jgi:hypothetical protein
MLENNFNFTVDRISIRSYLKGISVALFALMSIQGTAQAGGCNTTRCFDFEVKNASKHTIKTTVSNQGRSCIDYPKAGTTVTVGPGESKLIPTHAGGYSAARTQGHGCDGKQGYWLMDVTFLTSGGHLATAQAFNMSNHGGLAMGGKNTNYNSNIHRTNVPGKHIKWTWTIGNMDN